MTFEEIIITIEFRPKMLIGEIDIFKLQIFINGYFLGKSEAKSLSSTEIEFKENFHKWICNKYESPLQQGWAQVLYFYEGSHEKSISKFIEEYKFFNNR